MILPTPRPLARQVASTCRDLVVQPGLPFAQHLPAAQVYQLVQELGGAYRERIYTPAVTLWTFLTQVRDPDQSCQQAVDRLIAHRVAAGRRPCSADTGAYCRARRRLPEALLRALTQQFGHGLAENAEATWRWHGRPVQVVDGTGLSRPDTRANQRAYPPPATVRPGLGLPLARLVVVFSLDVGAVLDAALGRFEGKGSGEVSLFLSSTTSCKLATCSWATGFTRTSGTWRGRRRGAWTWSCACTRGGKARGSAAAATARRTSGCAGASRRDQSG